MFLADYAPFSVSVQLVIEIVAALTNDTVLKFKSAPVVPTVPCAMRVVLDTATQLVVLLVVHSSQCAAVPVADAAVAVIALKVRTPAETVPGVADSGITTRMVPASTVATLAGCAPVRIIRFAVAPSAVTRSVIAADRCVAVYWTVANALENAPSARSVIAANARTLRMNFMGVAPGMKMRPIG